jgi:hypothetical protein
MKQIEIDCVKDFTEKMRGFGYTFDVKIDERATVDFLKPDHKTELKLECWKRTENADTLPWNTFNLSFQLDNPQNHVSIE